MGRGINLKVFRICKKCGNNFEKIRGLRRNHCSEICQKSDVRKTRLCRDAHDLDYRMVIFRNGVSHKQAFCKKCKYHAYVPKNIEPKSKKIKSVKKTEIRKIHFLREKYGETFYTSQKWRQIRYEILKRYGPVCMACRANEGEMHVDHILPRSTHPELEYELSNLQVLCPDCNLGKGAWDETDWRPKDLWWLIKMILLSSCVKK